jgi:putative DNA primase/helicase
VRWRELEGGGTNKPARQQKSVSATYDYQSGEGELLYQVVRYDPKDFRQRRPDGRGDWIRNLDGVQRVLYRLPELNGADTEAWVFAVEGEKDVDRLWAEGLVATCNVGGAGKWTEEYSEILRGRRVCIIADKDEPGRKHAQAVAASLTGIAADVRVIECPGGAAKDASDFLSAGGTADQLIALAEAAPSWTPPNGGTARASKPHVLDPRDPGASARLIVGDLYAHADGQTLWYSDQFYRWTKPGYVAVEEIAIRSTSRLWLEQQLRPKGKSVQPFAPKTNDVTELVAALREVNHIDANPPVWLPGQTGPDPSKIIVARNAMLHLKPDGNPVVIGNPTPRFFSVNTLDFDYVPDAAAPVEWLKFLGTIWPDDQEAIGTLQEFCGYVLTADTKQQKALMLVGPKRAGKSTIARILTRLVGVNNTCNPTLAGMGTNFGMWALMGKLLAVVGDARLSGRTDQAIVTERILSLTGEDAITVDRKNLQPVTVRLRARLLLITNELPKLADASGALASRFIILTLRESFFDREDIELEAKLTAELPGILLWAIAGWQRLQQRGHFVQPASSESSLEELNDLASPISAFVRDYCKVGAGLLVTAVELYDAWRGWCREQGREAPGTLQIFGRDLRAALPGIVMTRRRQGDHRQRFYEGMDLTFVGKTLAEKARVGRDGPRSSL